ncbi:MAG: tRNA (adenosine(37)-N6)-threonylcarbamoyltransferase complex ATPase subunit type 1 TsaE [Gammaproteobacteria bacterium]|nr:tRNA (adenosine(37)-N6)-threonylcarbamoyltransferase complex ATPase subunit type 1 TsaE [Gammaproteobacteria bacterium]
MGGRRSAPEASFRVGSVSGLVALGRAMGEALAAVAGLREKLILGFDGELGAGKTTLIGGTLHALGLEAPVTSPTYGLVHPYAVRPPGWEVTMEILHIDLYRLQQLSELDELGLPEELPGSPAGPGGVLLVEWFANARGRLGKPDLAILLGHANPGRTVRVREYSSSGSEIARRLGIVSHPDVVARI